jgi:hypothetical protein
MRWLTSVGAGDLRRRIAQHCSPTGLEPDLVRFCTTHNLIMISVADLALYRVEADYNDSLGARFAAKAEIAGRDSL